MTAVDLEPYLRKREIAKFMGVTPRTIDYWVAEGCPFETWGMRLRVFRASDVVQWARNRAERDA